jgi:hypothetical protein
MMCIGRSRADGCLHSGVILKLVFQSNGFVASSYHCVSLTEHRATNCGKKMIKFGCVDSLQLVHLYLFLFFLLASFMDCFPSWWFSLQEVLLESTHMVAQCTACARLYAFNKFVEIFARFLRTFRVHISSLWEFLDVTLPLKHKF